MGLFNEVKGNSQNFISIR